MENEQLRPINIVARDIPDAWFQCLYSILEHGREYKVERGSFKGQRRLEFDFVEIRIKFPSTRPLIPDMPPGMGIPAPTSMEYVEDYIGYLFTDQKEESEDYTYGERLTNPKVRVSDTELRLNVDQIQEVIRMYREDGHGTNQAIMEIGMPSDILLKDPPCLRLIDTRVRYGNLHFFVYFRSWDLWAGLPSNLAAIQLVKEYMGKEIGVADGEIIALSKGLHLYDHVWDLARTATYK